MRDAMINSMGVQGVPLVNSLSCLSITMIIWEAYFVNIAPIVGHNENLLFNVEAIKLSATRAHTVFYAAVYWAVLAHLARATTVAQLRLYA